jgi:peptide/nickel transport system substrate-binding protein
VIESAAGEPFKFGFVYSSGGPIGERIALFLKDSYAKAGIVLVPDPADWPILMKKLNERTFEAITLAWGTSVESDIYQMFHSDQMKDQGDDFINYSNPELDKVIDKARTTIDREKRMPLWHRAHQIIHEDQPYMFLVQRRSLGFMDSRIQNVGTSRLGLNFNNRYVLPIPWYVPKGNQKWK